MDPHRFYRLLLILPLLLLLQIDTALADRAGWNEPGSEPGYGEGDLLKINTVYFNMAAATGGDFYYWAPGEFAEAAGLLNVPMASEPITLDYLSEGGPFDRVRDIPIDGTISQLSLFAGAQRLDQFLLLRPDGRSIEENPAGVTVQTFSHMRIVTLIDPEAGIWQARMRGEGSFELAARFLADRRRMQEREQKRIDLIDFEFVERRGRPGHQGLFPVSGSPQTGSEQWCRIVLTGGVDCTAVEFVSATGDVIGKVELGQQADLSPDELIGSCRVPEQPFRVRVQGKDRDGWSFQRVTSGLVTPGTN